MTVSKLILIILAVIPLNGIGACLSLVKGPMKLEVASCKMINPEQTFKTSREEFEFIKGLSPQRKKAYFNSYRGSYVTAKVSESQAILKGLDEKQGALLGNTEKFFLPPGKINCSNIVERQISVEVEQSCCDGHMEAPCALPTSYVIKKVGAIEKPTNSSSSANKKSKDYVKAVKAYKKKNYKVSSSILKKIYDEKKLDNTGLYILGMSYRNLDLCRLALSPLKDLDRAFISKSYSTKEEKYIRKGRLLLARCYAKLNNPDKAVPILNSFLSDKKKFRYELTRGLKDADFGWIHTSASYREFKENAEKALRSK